MLTLRRIEHTPGFKSGAQVKISHAAVGITTMLSNARVRQRLAAAASVRLAAAGLPLAQLGTPYVPGHLPASRRATIPIFLKCTQLAHDLRREGSSGR